MTDNRFADTFNTPARDSVMGSTGNEPAAPSRMAGESDRPHGGSAAYAADSRESWRDADHDASTGPATDETHELIAADKVRGTSVYDEVGDKIGSVDSVMINKVSGKVAYAVMSFGGFLGIGERFHPLPWDALSYDTGLGGYRVNQSADKLRDAPSYDRTEVDSYDYDRRGRELSGYYGFPSL